MLSVNHRPWGRKGVHGGRLPAALALWLLVACAHRPPTPPATPYTAAELAQAQRHDSAKFVLQGRGVVYVSDGSGAFELWLQPLSADAPPEQLTRLAQRVVDPQVAADGKTVVFGGDNGGDERFDLFQIDLPTRRLTPLTQTPTIAETSHRFAPDGATLALEADPATPFQPQIFLLDLVHGRRRPLTAGAIPVYKPVWSPDGRLLAATRSGDGQHGDLLLLPTAKGAGKVIPPPPGGAILWPREFAPDRRALLGLAKNPDGFLQLCLIDLATGGVRRIGPAQWDVGEAIWRAQAGIVFTRNIGGRYGLWRLARVDAAAEELLPAQGVISNLAADAAGRRLLFTREDATQPAAIYEYELDSRRLRRLTEPLPAGVDPARLSEAESFRIQSFDGTWIEGFIHKPPGFTAAQPYPAVALIHGGPDSQSVDEFYPLAQALTQAGLVVIRPNYRGSTGYGKAFEDLNNRDWGGGDRRDIRAVLEYFIDRGVIDRRRIGIAGGSYGGYMTLLALAKEPDFYRAGVDSFGMADLVEDYNLTKDRFGLWYETEMGTPTTEPALFADRSPIHFLDRIQAPLLIFQGANDTNVPLAESDAVVDKLRRLGRSVEYVVYPDEGHDFTRRANRIDTYQRTVDFFRAQLGVTASDVAR